MRAHPAPCCGAVLGHLGNKCPMSPTQCTNLGLQGRPAGFHQLHGTENIVTGQKGRREAVDVAQAEWVWML